MTFKKPLGANGTVIFMVSGKAGRATKTLQGRKHSCFLFSQFSATWSIFGPILAPTGFRRGPPIAYFQIKSTYNFQMKVQEGVLKNIVFKWIFDVIMGGLDKPKQAFRIILVAQYEFSGNCEL